jgi:hypothetical protein
MHRSIKLQLVGPASAAMAFFGFLLLVSVTLEISEPN